MKYERNFIDSTYKNTSDHDVPRLKTNLKCVVRTCGGVQVFLLTAPPDGQLPLRLLLLLRLDVELPVWIQVAADIFRKVKLPSELLQSVRAGAFIVLLLLLLPPADSQLPA